MVALLEQQGLADKILTKASLDPELLLQELESQRPGLFLVVGLRDRVADFDLFEHVPESTGPAPAGQIVKVSPFEM